jgi:hypothetical protein
MCALGGRYTSAMDECWTPGGNVVDVGVDVGVEVDAEIFGVVEPLYRVLVIVDGAEVVPPPQPASVKASAVGTAVVNPTIAFTTPSSTSGVLPVRKWIF